MKSRSSIRKGFAEVGDLWRERQYDRALAEVDRLLEALPGNASLLVMRSQLIQLQEDDEGTPTLDDARADLKLATDLDEQSPIPWIELGYFCYAIDDDAKAASAHFRKAVTLCKRLLREALIGQSGALEELGREAEARDCLVQAYLLNPANGKSSSEYPSNEEIVERLKSL